ncbi:hypothetical protein Pcinc_006385 [Petrolisthes cinctipes]|uniref:RanBD1 domain-containing protein n=1 Tax=Petrolisthes cinctipes TaxID=88211 RepID=A0AAE1GBM4_PETCI|nr:hypothetical protein Pcinc_006385 [Petrolisthes cinctipes]
MGTTTNPTMDTTSQYKESEVSSEGGRRNAEPRDTKTTTTRPSTTTTSSSSSPIKTGSNQFQGDGNVSSSDSGINSISSSSSSSSSSTTRSPNNTTTTTTTTTLGATGMGNPFARAAPQTTWAESAEQRPILAPPRLGSPLDQGVKSSSSSSSSSSLGGGVLRPSALGTGVRLSGGTMKAPSSFFPPPALTITGSSPPQQQPIKTEFKLKPSVLSSSPNPFVKSTSEPQDTTTTTSSTAATTTTTTTTEDGGSSDKPDQSSSTTTPDKQQQQQHQQHPSSAPPHHNNNNNNNNKDDGGTTNKSEEHNNQPTTTTTTGGAVNSKAGNNSNNSSNSNSNNSSNLFLPLGNDSDSASSPTLAKNSFIFGHNLHSKINATGGSVGGVGIVTTAAVGTGGGGGGGGGTGGGGGGGGTGGGGGGGGGGWGVSSTSADSSHQTTTNGEKLTGNLFSDAASEVSRWSDGTTTTAATTNGQPHTGNLFSEAASGITQPQEEWRVGQSLEESSREITEKEKSQKRKFDEVEVITGEENESNVLQMNCKLYAMGEWLVARTGVEVSFASMIGTPGQEIRSRLVIRTQGTLTVMLNTKVWAEMSVERASSKSVRFTALDADGQPKIFLAMVVLNLLCYGGCCRGSPKDVDLLYNSLEYRVAASRNQSQDDNTTTTSSSAASTSTSSTSDNTKKPKTDDDTTMTAPLPS